MNENVYMYTCSRCGNDVKSTARYCMKCGCLNPSHPENKKYEALFRKIGMQEYHVSADGITVQATKNEVRGGLFSVAFGMHSGNFNFCFLVNYLAYLFVIAITGLVFYAQTKEVTAFASSSVSYFFILFSIIALAQYSTQLLFMKMNRHWVTAIIPFYNLYVLSDTINDGKNKVLSLLVFVPFIGQLYCLYLFYQVGKAFHSSGILTALFPFIMIPLIGFGSSPFTDVFYVSGTNSLEQEFTKKKIFFVTNVVIILVSIVLVVYTNIVSINKGIDFTSNYYLYFASQQLISSTKDKVERDGYVCEYYDSTLYFYFVDVGDYAFLPLYITRDPIEAYIKVVVHPEGEGILNKYDYYISMTDGTYGYPETNVEEFSTDSIKEYKELDPVYEYDALCYFK